jgi:nucleotide-binding universal stress UspA family protein
MKILVAVDGSVYTKRMLAYIAAHDEWLGDRHEYTLLHVVQPVPHGARQPGPGQGRAQAAYYADTSQKIFKPLAHFLPAPWADGRLRRQGRCPADCMAERPRKGRFDLLMMGSHGHGSA